MSYAPILSAAEIERIRVFAQPKMVTAGQIRNGRDFRLTDVAGKVVNAVIA